MEETVSIIQLMVNNALNGKKVNQLFSTRYMSIVSPLYDLGWLPNYLEWNYLYDNGVKLEVVSLGDCYKLTVSM